MRIVAVRAIHESGIDRMLERHREVGPYIRVALVAELGLRFCQKKFRSLRLVNGMALGAHDAVQRVRRFVDVGPREALRMAAKADIENLRRAQVREGPDRRLSAVGCDVQLAGAVAALAAGVLRRFLARCDALKVRILEESKPYVRMAGLADHAAHIPVLLKRIGRLAQNKQYKEAANRLDSTHPTSRLFSRAYLCRRQFVTLL